jgi:hypothetical protein
MTSLSPPSAVPLPTDRRALYWLAASNAVVVVIALWQRWPLGLLLWPYWLQSVIIGYFSFRRIRGLTRFSTEGFKVNGRAAEPTEATKRSTANFFAFHYGFFHVGYGVFLLKNPLPPQEWLWVGIAAVTFALNHRQSFTRFQEADRQGSPNIGTLMFLPYLRVVPMHLMIIIGVGFLGGGGLSVLFFGVLKTVADCAMHVAEHRMLARRPAA